MTMCTEMIFRTCRPSSERSTMWFQRSKEQNQTNHALTAGAMFLLLLILPVITLLPSAIIPVIVLPSVILVIIRLINLVLISL